MKKKTYQELEQRIIDLERLHQESLSESDRQYRELFTSMSVIFQIIELIYDSNGKAIDYYLRDVNPSFEKLVAKERSQLIGKRAKDLFAVVEDHWLQTYDKVAKTGQSINTENYSGELDKHYELFAWKVDKKRVAIILNDTTKRKLSELALLKAREKAVEREKELRTSNAELGQANIALSAVKEELREGKKKYKQLYYSNLMPIAVFDAQSLKFLSVNKACTEKYGYTEQEFSAMTIMDIRPPSEIQKVKKSVQLKDEGVINAGSYIHKKKNGEIIHVEIIRSDISFDGTPAKMVVINDVTDRVKALEEIEMQNKALLDSEQELQASNHKYLRLNKELSEINTELRAVKDQIEDSESKFRAIFDHSTNAIGVSKNGTGIFFNPAYLKLFGYEDAEALSGKKITEQIAVRERHRIEKYVKDRKTDKDTPTNYESVGLRKNGEEFDMEIAVSTYELGKEKYTVVIIRDITERKFFQNELDLQNKKLNELNYALNEAQELSHVGSWDLNIETNEVIWSRELLNIFELPHEVGAPNYIEHKSLYTDASYAVMDQAVNNCIHHEIPYEIELDIYTSKGSLKHIISKGKVKKDHNNKVIGCNGTAQDITQQKLFQKKLDLQNKKLNELNFALNQAQKLSHVGSWTWNMATDEAIWSDEMYNIYGVSKETFYPSNENVTKTVFAEDLPKLEESIGSLVNNQIFEPFEFRIKRPSGEKRDLYIVALEQDSRTTIFGVTQDITERKIAEREFGKQNKILIESEKQLQSLNEEYLSINEDLNESNIELNTAKDKITKSLEEKELLLRELYHRTKNNMQVISSMLSIKSSYTDNREVKEILAETKSKIMGMALVHQKLYQAKDLSWIDLKDYIKDLVELLKSNLLPKNTNLQIVTQLENTRTNIDTAIPCGLIINELFTNALKHGFPDNKAGIIRIALKKLHDEICISIADNGVGIPDGLDFKHSNSYGLEAVVMLSELQLGGSITLNMENGTEFILKFKESLKADRV